MLSKKMAFSLSIITIFALAFMAPSAMAADDFDATFSVDDVSHLADSQSERATEIDVTLTFGEKVSIAAVQAAKIIVRVEDKYGNETVSEITGAAVVTDVGGPVAAKDTDPDTAGNQFNGKTYTFPLLTALTDADSRKVYFFIAAGVKIIDPGSDKSSKKGSLTVNLVGSDPASSDPELVSIAATNRLLVPDAGFTGDTFDVVITLSEQPKENKLTKDHIAVDKGTAGDPVYLGAVAAADGGDADTTIDPATGRDGMHHRYVVTITPKAEDGDLVVKVKEFEDNLKGTVDAATGEVTAVAANKYVPPIAATGYVEGYDKLTVKIKKASATALAAGHEVNLINKRVIPAGGYLIVATATADTGINLPDDADADDNTPKIDKRSPAELKYNAISVDIPNLEAFLSNGGTIDLVSPDAGLMISEIMWGSDASLETNSNSQWIEIHNTTAAAIATGDKTHKLIFYGPNETVPAKTAAVAATATTEAVPAALPAGVVDRVGTINDKGGYWSLAGKGQSGRTGFGEAAGDLTAIIPTQNLISMYRVTKADAAGNVPLGNTAAAWMQSTPPAVNMDPAKGGNRLASPGSDEIETAAEKLTREAEEQKKEEADLAAKDTSVSMPKVGQIYISEVMFAGGGTLPQWIEISNGSRTEEVNLSGWTITVDNATADADVSVGVSIELTIPEGTKIDPSGQNDTPSTILVVTEQGRNNLSGASAASQVLNLWTANQTELILAGVTKRRYSLLSEMAFQITLAPPVPTATTAPATETAAEKATRLAAERVDANARKAATDTVGNLGADGAAAWALPMSEEGGRSSIIRRHVPVSVGPASPEAGIMMDSWALASDTSFAQVTHIRASSYYGAANDVGTPGFRAGGALPVELSHFRPARDRATGQVVITWSTQSELNNAGFFIKRSQQKDGEFQVINATMIAGAGTTSEKQFYTYTDTTAQPNVVYYYQIEDVSLDGNRQTLTRGIRLKGHVSVAGKLTSIWGELKTSNE